MGYLVTGKSAFFQTPLLLGTMEKTAPFSLEHQFYQRRKSSAVGGVLLYSTHGACFLHLVTSSSCRIYYVTFGKKVIANSNFDKAFSKNLTFITFCLFKPRHYFKLLSKRFYSLQSCRMFLMDENLF